MATRGWVVPTLLGVALMNVCGLVLGAGGPDVEAGSIEGSEPTAAGVERVIIKGSRAQLDAARNGLSPDTGSSVYHFGPKELAALPQGESTPLNSVLLQAPGVVQGGSGQLHVRGDHGNLQYRLNGVIIPEALGGFGETLDTRFADQITVLTGALPAQYGYRTAGVIDIRTKGVATEPGGAVTVNLGQRGHRELGFDASGGSSDWTYFVSASHLRSDQGIENPMPTAHAVHDRTDQSRAMAYTSYTLGRLSRVSLLVGYSDNRFEIPNIEGEQATYSLLNTPTPSSLSLDARQTERSGFAVVSFQGGASSRPDVDDIDYQVSLFQRTGDQHYQPDAVGDLVYRGVAADVKRSNTVYGLQADLSWHLTPEHTLRSGFFVQHERQSVDSVSTVFPADDEGAQTSLQSLTVMDAARQRTRLYGAYLQDEWRPAKGLTINGGLRWDQASHTERERQWSPRLGVTWDWSKTARLHAGYARYFTPPPTEKIDSTSIQKFLGTSNALPSDANTAVRAERSDYWDIGFAQQLAPGLTLGVDAYWRQVKHLQDEGQFGNALIYSAFNFTDGRIHGIEFSLNYRSGGLSANLNWAISHGTARGIESGEFNFDADELAYIRQNWVNVDHDQRYAASGNVSYRYADGLLLSISGMAGSGLRNGFANTGHLPAYGVVGAAVSKPLDLGAPWGKAEVRLSVSNLFDRSYLLRDGSGIGVGAPQYGQRRSVYLSMSKSF